MHRLGIFFALCGVLAAADSVAIVAPADLPAPARHGLTKLEESLRRHGFEIAASAAEARFVVDLRIGSPASAGAESLSVRRTLVGGKLVLQLAGADARGLMYAALDTAERVTAGDPFRNVVDIAESPYLLERGISMYTMQRAYFESRLYDERYWERYFDLLSADRINSFVVIFGYENGGFMAPVYPYFFNVEGFPQVELTGITAKQQSKNTAAFKAMMRIAHDRGIEVTAGIWDHIYRGGVQGGGIPGASENAGKRVPGLVWGVTADNLASYNKAGLRRFLEVFPEIDAVQFRMHDESGLKKSEIEPFWHDVFTSIKANHPRLKLDLRAKELPDAVISDALSQGLKTRISTKFWMEQEGLPFHPTHINVQNQRERRHGYADLLRYPQSYKVHWQLWSGGTTRLLLWGDPEYVRRFAKSAKLYDGESFEVNEMLATKMLGAAHDEKPVDILNAQYRYYDYEFERYWHFYRVWGRLTYNPDASRDVWEREFVERFGAPAGPHLMRALNAASWILPRIVASSYRYNYFPTTRGWAEMNHQDSLPKYATEEGSDIAQFMNLREEADSLILGTPTAMRRPEENSRWFERTAQTIEDEIAKAGAVRSKEEVSTVTDLRILVGLARYHGRRLRAGVAYNLWKSTGSLQSFQDAINFESDAIAAWKQIVRAAGDVYSDRLQFGAHAVGFRHHWNEEYGLIEKEQQELLAEFKNAVERPGAIYKRIGTGENHPPAVVVGGGITNERMLVTAKLTPSSEVQWVRLRYRHMTQFEDYLTAEMKFDKGTGLYQAEIPMEFAGNWRLGIMWYVEVVDRKGNGRNYPDLDVETPYRIAFSLGPWPVPR